MRRWLKPGLVLGGYLAAFAVACLAVLLRQLATQGPDADASSGMYAAGDMMLFLVVLGGLELIPTAFALYFFRSQPRFWLVLANGALAFAAIGIAWLAAVALSWPPAGRPEPDSLLELAGALSLLRVLIGPLLAAIYLMCAAVAPAWRWRWRLAGAVVLEFGMVVAFFRWI